jgi:hypothetical protein
MSRMHQHDNGVPVTLISGGGDGGEPGWVAGLRSDIRALGTEFSTAIRHQTLIIVIIACLAMLLNTALVLSSLAFSWSSQGVTLQTSQ